MSHKDSPKDDSKLKGQMERVERLSLERRDMRAGMGGKNRRDIDRTQRQYEGR